MLGWVQGKSHMPLSAIWEPKKAFPFVLSQPSLQTACKILSSVPLALITRTKLQVQDWFTIRQQQPGERMGKEPYAAMTYHISYHMETEQEVEKGTTIPTLHIILFIVQSEIYLVYLVIILNLFLREGEGEVGFRL